MGLITKIEDKLSSNKGQSDSSKLQKSSYEDSSSNSRLQHPVGTGSTSQNYGSSTTGSSGLTGSHGEHGTSSVARDGYGHSSSGYGNTGSNFENTGRSDLAPGGHGSNLQNTGRSDLVSGGHGSGMHPSSDYRETGHPSSDYRETGTSSGGPREPYDPYSSKGQATAANAASGYPGETSRGEYGSSNTYANDPNVPRTRMGGIMHSGSDPAAHNPSAIPSAGGQKVGSTDVNDPYSSSSHHSSGHPIRDAAMAGGVASGHHGSSHNPQDVSYMNRSGGGEMGSGMEPTHRTGGMTDMGSGTQPTTHAGGMMGTGSSAPSIDPKKMSNAYEAGYRDGMEHAKEEMGTR